jgi:hypothetical protein
MWLMLACGIVDVMANGREPQQIAKRAVILGAVSFRSSLEVTAHPRVVEISGRLVPWLIEVGCESEVDPIERELLATPLGQLSDSQRSDARWAGEGAAVFCWMLKLSEVLEERTLVNPTHLPGLLGILKPQAMDIIGSAALRDRNEIEATCRQFVLILSMLRESRVGPPASDIIRRIHVQELSGVGIPITEDSVRRVSELLGKMTPQERSQVAGLYFVRHHAALWFLSGRSNYFT